MERYQGFHRFLKLQRYVVKVLDYYRTFLMNADVFFPGLRRQAPRSQKDEVSLIRHPVNCPPPNR